jgi:hypothetical protein
MEKNTMKRLVLLATLFAAAHAGASGDYGPSYQRFKAYTYPDIELERYQAGELGVLQPGLQRVYLYTAWRAIALGPKRKTAPATAGGLERADGSAFGSGWVSGQADPASVEAWQRESGNSAGSFGACPPAGNAFALDTLRLLRARKDATPVRVQAWTDAQELVWKACKAVEEARYRDENALKKVLVPAALPGTEPLFWRQLRDYQRGATNFYAERYPEASAQFDAIGATAGHPMQGLGRYLALRAEVRAAVKQAAQADEAQRQRLAAGVEQRAQAMLADAALAPLRETIRATVRSARARLVPQAVVAELSRQLADPAADPFQDDRLGDWAFVMRGDEYAEPAARAARFKELRPKYEFFDWIETLHDCGYTDDLKAGCRSQAQHAALEWQRTKSRPWMVAAMMMADTLAPALEKAAVAVKAGEPEYPTVRYHLARLYRLAGRVDEARAVSDAALKLTLPNGSRNLFLEERFALATSVADAARFMLRVDVDFSRGTPDKPHAGLNEDSVEWMLRGLAAADMLELARQPVLEAPIRARLASAAWMRADLLGKYDVALQALGVLEPLVPALAKAIADYRKLQAPAERRHLMLLTALKFGLSPQMTESSMPIAPLDAEDVAASNWCSFKPDEPAGVNARTFPWLMPPSPAVGDRAAAASEMARLAPLKTATGFIGDHVLGRVKTHADDPELPWLLHVVVASTRGGCLDADSKKLSREAFNVLHKRFPRNEWTTKTPYFY